jgi:hypothetical protein
MLLLNVNLLFVHKNRDFLLEIICQSSSSFVFRIVKDRFAVAKNIPLHRGCPVANGGFGFMDFCKRKRSNRGNPKTFLGETRSKADGGAKTSYWDRYCANRLAPYFQPLSCGGEREKNLSTTILTEVSPLEGRG